MDISNLNTTERELICDAIKIAISPEVLKMNDRFWHMEDLMQEIMEEIMAGRGFAKLGCEHESWGLICDAIEIAISPEVIKMNDTFRHKRNYMNEIVKEIERQSGCMTKDD
ncbi:MAG: hypothetical protein Q8O46_02430 [bacterium]|nr:hypothetical protein [bacterium]